MIYRDKVTVEGSTVRGSHGNILRAMGDINIVDGQEVWTDGKVIYGHQTAGYQDVPVPHSGVMPVGLCYDYSDGLPTVASVTDYNDTTKEISNAELMAFVSDGLHSYGAKRSANGRNDELQWYNLVTGESLGIFPVMDACVDKEGNLLTIDAIGSSYSGEPPGRDIKYDCYAFFAWAYSYVTDPPNKVYSNVGGSASPSSLSNPEYGWIYPVKRFPNKDAKYGNEHGAVIIRRNGRIVKEYSIDKYRDHAKAEVAAKLQQVHDGGDSSGEVMKFGRLQQFYKRPGAYVESAGAYLTGLHINIDGSWYGFLSSSARGMAYPWFSWNMDIVKAGDYEWKESWPIKEYPQGGIVQSIVNIFGHILGNDTIYRIVYNDTISTKRVKIFLHAPISYSDSHVISSDGKDDTTMDLLEVRLDAGTVVGSTGLAPKSTSKFNIIRGTEITGVEYSIENDKQTPPEVLTTISLLSDYYYWYPFYYYSSYITLGTGSYSAFGNKYIPNSNLEYFEEFPEYYNKNPTHGSPSSVSSAYIKNYYTKKSVNVQLDAYAKAKCQGSHVYYTHGKPFSGTFPLNDGYKIRVNGYSPYPYNVQSFTILTDTGDVVYQVSQFDWNRPYFLFSAWWLIKVGKLKNGKYIIGVGSDYSYFLTVDKQTGAQYDYSKEIHAVYSLEYVKNWPIVKENIKKLIPGYSY